MVPRYFIRFVGEHSFVIFQIQTVGTESHNLESIFIQQQFAVQYFPCCPRIGLRLDVRHDDAALLYFKVLVYARPFALQCREVDDRFGLSVTIDVLPAMTASRSPSRRPPCTFSVSSMLIMKWSVSPGLSTTPVCIAVPSPQTPYIVESDV